MIAIETYTAEALVAFTQSETYQQMPVIPISAIRASSLLNSPKTLPTDIVMVCAFHNDTLVGYLGLLPDECVIQHNPIRFGWLSGMWVSEHHRGKGIASSLINTMLTVWNDNVLTTNQSPVAALVFQKHKKFVCKENTGKRFYLRSRLAGLVPQKIAWTKRLSWALHPLDFILNSFFTAYRSIGFKKVENYKVFNTIDDTLAAFLNQQQLNNVGTRRVVDFEWMMNYPWVKQSAVPDSFADKYEFTISTPDYRNEFVVCVDVHERIIAAALVMLKKGELKVSYIWANNSALDTLGKAVFQYALNHSVYEISVFNLQHQSLIAPFAKWCLHQRNLSRHYYLTAPIQKVFEQSTAQFFDGDGDCSFA